MSHSSTDDQHPVSDADSQEPALTDHSYDGIQEYDNPLPGWWKFLFWVSVVFAPIYYVYIHAGVEGRSIHDEYNAHMAEVFELRFSEIGELEPDRETILEYMEKEDWLKVGQVVYTTNCVSCHKADGSGAVGPNLTDDHWKNVRNVEDIAKVISEGAANGAMPAWKNRMSHQNQIVLTAAYVASMRKSPKPGKAPEGNEIPPWSE
jgi:cytochrome c oxidase cbb3-type subunit 3